MIMAMNREQVEAHIRQIFYSLPISIFAPDGGDFPSAPSDPQLPLPSRTRFKARREK